MSIGIGKGPPIGVQKGLYMNRSKPPAKPCLENTVSRFERHLVLYADFVPVPRDPYASKNSGAVQSVLSLA